MRDKPHGSASANTGIAIADVPPSVGARRRLMLLGAAFYAVAMASDAVAGGIRPNDSYHLMICAI